mgnify:CR=1 FL=1
MSTASAERLKKLNDERRENVKHDVFLVDGHVPLSPLHKSVPGSAALVGIGSPAHVAPGIAKIPPKHTTDLPKLCPCHAKRPGSPAHVRAFSTFHTQARSIHAIRFKVARGRSSSLEVYRRTPWKRRFFASRHYTFADITSGSPSAAMTFMCSQVTLPCGYITLGFVCSLNRALVCSEDSSCEASRCVHITLGFPCAFRTPDVRTPDVFT